MILNVFVAFHKRGIVLFIWLKGEPPVTRIPAAGSQKKCISDANNSVLNSVLVVEWDV